MKKNDKGDIPSAGLKELKSFFRFVRPYWFRAVLGLIAAASVGAFDGAFTYLLKPFIDNINVVPGQGQESLPVDVSFYPLLIVVVAVVQSGFSFAANYLITWSGKKIGNDVKLALFDKLMRADPATFDKHTSGEILLRYGSDADAASEGILTNSKTLITRVVTSVVLICVMFYLSWILAVVALSALLVTVIPLSIIRKRIKAYIRDSVHSSTVVTTNYNETYSGNRVITSYNLQDFARERLRQTLSVLFRLSVKMAQKTSLLSLIMHFATAVGFAAVVWLQGYLIINGHITFGTFAAFITAMLMLYTPIKKIGNTLSTIQICLMAVHRIQEMLEIEPTIASKPDAKKPGAFSDFIVYRDVNFSYEPDKPVLRDINLEIKAGQSVAFVGNSGGGKTTLVNLLPRFYDVCGGSISIDGTDIRDIDLVSLRELIAIVFQDNFLFGGTIRENIMLGNRSAGEEDLNRAVKAACLEEFIGSLEHGLDTPIGERGTLLSGGQKQRVAIARAFIKDAPIVILDEATSALDNKSETVVQQAIENLMVNKTVFIIAHRLSTVVNADRIVVIRDGEMVESGKHNELIANPDGAYASLYKTQLH